MTNLIEVTPEILKQLGATSNEADPDYAPADYRWTMMSEGKLLPVTNLYDSDGNEINNPMRAVRCVAFEGKGKWLALRIEPGDVTVRRAG